MTFEELKATAQKQGATYVFQLHWQTQDELRYMMNKVTEGLPWWERDNCVESPEDDLMNSKVADLDEMFKMYNEALASDFCEALKEIANSPTGAEALEGYLSMHFATWFKNYVTTPEGLIDELQHFAKM